MFSQEDCTEARQMFKNGQRPSMILRVFALRQEQASIPDLMEFMRQTFLLSYEDSQCIGGWWHDGAGEISDDQLDGFLVPSIRSKI